MKRRRMKWLGREGELKKKGWDAKERSEEVLHILKQSFSRKNTLIP